MVTTSIGLVIAPDKTERATMVRLLRLGGVARVLRRASPEEAAGLLDRSPLHLLAVTVPDLAGPALALIRRCRAAWPKSVILAIDEAQGPDSAAAAFRAGADDVMRRPLPDSEFLARLSRRLGDVVPHADGLFGLVDMNLTPVEVEVLRALMAQRGEIVTRNDLARRIDDCDWVYGDRRFDVHVTSIRKKLKQRLGDRVRIRTIRAAGYRLETDMPSDLSPGPSTRPAGPLRDC